MKTVAIVLFDELLLLDVAGPLEVFSVANRYLPAEEGYRIITISAGAREVRASNGMRMTADYCLADAPASFDILLVPGGPGAYDRQDTRLWQWLREVTPNSAMYGSICTGAFILAAAGLLDQRQVTTHWHYLERFIKRFPAALVETNQVVVQDGDLVTSGGVTTGIDLALHIVAQQHGRAVALDIAKVLLVRGSEISNTRKAR